MKIRTRISLIYTLLTAGIFLFFAGTIYYSAEKNREKEFFNALRKEALTKANLIADANVPAETLQKIYLKNREILDEVEVAIYNTHFELIYHDAVEIDFVKETETMLAEIMAEKSIEFFQEKWQVVGLLFEYKDQLVHHYRCCLRQIWICKNEQPAQNAGREFYFIADSFVFVGNISGKKSFYPGNRNDC
jgi:two-component system, OmpR family, sensor histidine kinase ArlS